MTHANDNNAPIRFLSVCSGIEAASVAWGPLGWEAVAFSEIEKFPSAVLAHHYPDVPNLGDFTKIDTTTLGRVDILCGGTPCQAFSVAGLRNSLADARGNLTLSFVRLAHELAGIAEIGPEADGLVRSSERQLAGNGLRNVVWENVPGVLNTKDNAFGCFLGALVGAGEPLPAPRGTKWPDAGMVSGPKGRAAWRILDAQYFGLAQRRRRVILVADFGNGADPAAVLFELESVFGNPAPSREARETTTHDVAPSLVSSGRGVSRTGDTRGQDPAVAVAFGGNNTAGPIDIATAVNAHGGPHGRLDFESETFVAQPIVATLDASFGRLQGASGQDANHEHSHLIAFSAKDYGADATEELSPTLRAGGHTTSHANAGVMPAIAMSVAIRGREGGGTAELGGEVATALRASQGGGDKPHVLATREVAGAITSNYGKQLDNSDTALGPNVAIHHSAVRRLTPTERERLMGFPDGYTAIPWRNKPADQCPDGPRYKALGNSWAVPKFHWLGKRIAALMPQDVYNAAA